MQIHPDKIENPRSLPEAGRSATFLPPVGMLPIERIATFSNPKLEGRMLAQERVAIHSGKLGDIIYALPACRALGINHLVVNSYLPDDDPLRVFTVAMAEQIVPLLLSQPYLEKVSISKSAIPLEHLGPQFPGVHYNFDFFRKVARNRAALVIENCPKLYTRYFTFDPPAHLGEIFASALGFNPDLEEAWLFAKPRRVTNDTVIISLTNNWRSFSSDYWKLLTIDLPNIHFVGTEREWKAAGLSGAKFVPTANHLELAEVIAGASLFLGTVSFPYAIAEGLKVPRFVEICRRQMNAFPVGQQGKVLPPNVLAARSQVADQLGLSADHPYRAASRRLKARVGTWCSVYRESLQALISATNQPLRRTARYWLLGCPTRSV